jgi:hypothetical protein
LEEFSDFQGFLAKCVEQAGNSAIFKVFITINLKRVRLCLHQDGRPENRAMINLTLRLKVTPSKLSKDYV